MDVINLTLLLLLALGIVGNNATVSIAVAILLLMRLFSLERYFPLLEQHGLQVGIIILTIGILAPLASGKVNPASVLALFTHWHTILAIIMGVFVAYLAGKGTDLMSGNPLIVTGLLLGTIIGVTFFRGVAVGPLIAAGMLAFLLQFLPK
ncbi:DUF441 domain-containing protein [Brevibacillus sp. FSL K6-0770]|jgi:uncharacterized membrane protein (DUF441 family)|uniref:UPF0756 membrane protein BPA01_33490 n=1 Tax=Brevibacillus parabrevis TaxID=54914 RepID=A0A4Y3PRN2_BREPA|nr:MULTISPECIES: DUF441 domain-containing protein [Brevibacillus]MDH6350150.1 uncharacterized membrane protein (DUF441 family) [Brevibacillus sp. 1238]MDR4999592.1 DUF441 domain-containing protein [Brevibacillus parabrevis]MED2253846.1 DUF441 domain-containing protein [Brevibacillus parabrevis]RNB94505.1 DUF441 domain-containing protein [Brevibacillus parabrevis]GEB33769.1 UPF0756 membrane protein [Brevibacillus parabrevis]